MKIEGPKEELIYHILELVLKKTDPDIRFSQSPETYSGARMIAEIESGNIDVGWGGINPDMEKRLRSVKIPVLKGLLGHRIFIIRAADQNRFAQIQTLDDLKRFHAGQGTFWGDTVVLKNAQIPVVTTIKYANLFPMLEGGRFDYFPRAVHEPWVEVQKRPELNLVVDKNILLIYPFAMYFYVNQSNTVLHDKIYNGFETAIRDGSFDQLFFNHPMIKDVLHKANLTHRKIFRIDNPIMGKDTEPDRAEFWLNIDELENL
ncbi:substrate-binding periplasmic protein [Vibrio aerogenes]|nr:transporter substrate-binding domain-containing protein [Vibrio aerogenes]